MDKIIFKLLLLDGNETSVFCKESYDLFKSLIIEIVKIKYDVRWCDGLNCPCWAETKVLTILEDNKIKKFLTENNLYDTIKTLATYASEIPPNTVWAEDGDHLREGTEYL